MSDPNSPKILHEYPDGIQEADEPMPSWWLMAFFACIVFAAGYYFWYEQFAVGKPQLEEWRDDVAARTKKKGGGEGPTAASLLALAQDSSAVGEGKTAFAQNCAACHGDKAEGKIGPNLTDDAWLHGGNPEEIYKTISKGVVEKGMPSWEGTLGGGRVQRLTAFVLSVKNTNVPGKAPQGTSAAAAPAGAGSTKPAGSAVPAASASAAPAASASAGK